MPSFPAFVLSISACIFSGEVKSRQILLSCITFGREGAPVVAVLSAFVGMSLAVQGNAALGIIGGADLISAFIALAGMREMAPIAAAAMIAAKSGTGITAQLATMRTKLQLDAMQVMAVDPIAELIAPRVIGMLILVPLLVLLANFTCLAAGFFSAVVLGGSEPGAFLHNLPMFVGTRDLAIGAGKGLFFGLCIGLVSTYYGFTATGGAKGVGRAANRTVIALCIICLLADCLFTMVFYA